MTIAEANGIVNSFYRKDRPSDDDIFIFTEALDFLINETCNPKYMMQLGGYYYGRRDFHLARKYYEMAAEYNDPDAFLCLGYIWYYGRTGEKDYEKAFKYYSLAMDAGSYIAMYKLADMYKNGYYVDKDYNKYKEIIEQMYPKMLEATYLGDPVPEVFTRLAGIREKEGKEDEAIVLYLQAKDFLAQRISYNPFFGDLNIMMWLIDDLYKLQEFDMDYFDFYDLYYLLTKPNVITFRYNGKPYKITVGEENGEQYIEFNGKYYHNREDFFKGAYIGKKLLTYIYDELYEFEVE